MDGAALVLTDATRLAAEKPLQIVWGFDTSAGGDGVVATASIKSLADLKGKRVGYLPGSFGHLFVAKMLESAGLTEADIIPVKLGGSEEVPSALKTGQIDAGFTSDPFLTQAVDEGAVKLLTSADLPGVIVDVLAFQSQVVEQNPQQIRAITRALAKAMDYWEHNPEEGNSIVANAIGATAEDVPAMLPGVRTYTLKDNQVAFDRSTADPLSLYAGSSATADFLLKQGIIKQALNLDTFINPSFVQAVSGG
jgi:NitT/TauT family transport system substrate-binding protein